jgi:hypothetical protein
MATNLKRPEQVQTVSSPAAQVPVMKSESQRAAARARKAPTTANAIEIGDEAAQSIRPAPSSDITSTVQPERSFPAPNWEEWKANRPFCQLWEALLLAHNVAANSTNLARLKKGSSRTSIFMTRRGTAHRAVRERRLFSEAYKNPDSAEIFLPNFYEWLTTTGWDSIPPELAEVARTHARLSEHRETPRWEHWQRMPSLSVREVVLLSRNTDPAITDTPKAPIVHSSFFKECSADEDAIVRHLEAGTLLACDAKASRPFDIFTRISPAEFLRFATQHQWNVTSKFAELFTPLPNTGIVAQDHLPRTSQDDRTPTAPHVKLRNTEVTLGALYLMICDLILGIREKREFDTTDLLTNDRPNKAALIARLSETYLDGTAGQSNRSIRERIDAGLAEITKGKPGQ